jgi:phosphoenolpyruvate carboxykinase (ATP)
MLTADAFGVMPPIAKLSPSQAMYHFLSGFTARVAGTEKGMGSQPEPTFSTCFGAPFMPLHPSVYGNLLRDLIDKYDCDCWLVNTGWTGGLATSGGKRMPIKLTRALLAAVLDGSLAGSEWRVDPVFGFRTPVKVAGVATAILNPRDTWKDKAAFDAQAKKLAGMFRDNFKKYIAHVDERVLKNADQIAKAAG